MAISMPKKIDSINGWIDVAARGLAKDAWVRVREETYAHYESARQESLAQGASEQHAHDAALASLGNARPANKQYKKIYLTAWERKLVREDEWAAKAFHSRPYLWIILLLAVCGAVAVFALRQESGSLGMLVCAIGLFFVLGVPFVIPINTRLRGNVYRTLRLTWLIAILWIPYSFEGLGKSWAMFFALSAPSYWMIAWMEWSRASARKKLPVAEWPRTLYL